MGPSCHSISLVHQVYELSSFEDKCPQTEAVPRMRAGQVKMERLILTSVWSKAPPENFRWAHGLYANEFVERSTGAITSRV